MRRFLLIALLALLALPSGRVAAAPWNSVFAAESDTTYFLLEGGEVICAPFGLQSRQLLWRAPQGQHVVRLLASPGGGRVAWISRGLEADTTRLWIGSAAGTELRLRYFALQPRRHGQEYSEISWPTMADAAIHGARLLSPTFRPFGPAANGLAWSADGREVIVGYDGGIAAVAPGGRGASRLSGHRALALEPLRPSRAMLVDALDSASTSSRPLSQFDLDHVRDTDIDVKEGHVLQPLERRRMLLRPEPGGLREIDARSWLQASVRCAGEQALWWAEGRVVKGLRVADGASVRERRTASGVSWLAFDAAGCRVLGLSGRVLWRADEEGGAPVAVLEAASGVRGVSRSACGRLVALATRDSLLTWNIATGEVRRLRDRGDPPDLLFEGSDGSLVVAVRSRTGQPVSLRRCEAGRDEFVSLELPREVRWQPLVSGPRCAWLLAFEPGLKPPGRIHAYDVDAGLWHVVDNPGIVAWEAFPD